MIVLFDLSAAQSPAIRHRTGEQCWGTSPGTPTIPAGTGSATVQDAGRLPHRCPAAIVDKPATADLIHGQTDEIDLGVRRARDRICTSS
jgi:hypothetical protein